MTKYTPEPWLLDGTYIYQDDTLGRTIADCRHSTSRPLDECRANAVLMHAAPDLLAACKLALNAFENAWLIDWNELKAAIAKAEGR